MKSALVLEGGAMRGMYTAGVLDVMMENDIHFDMIAGVSAGALFGVNYCSKQPGRVIRYNKRFNKDPLYMGLVPLVKEGNIVSTEYAYDKVPTDLDPFDDETFMKSDTDFYAVITDIETGMPSYRKIRSGMAQMDVLRASGSLPFVSKPVEIGGRKYMDGGIADSIPFEWAARQGYEKIVVVLTRDENYRKNPLPKAGVRLLAREYPELEKKLLKRHEQYNRSVEKLKKLEAQGKVFVIRPDEPIRIAKLEKDPEKLQAVYDLGIKDMNELLPSLRRYLDQETDKTENE